MASRSPSLSSSSDDASEMENNQTLNSQPSDDAKICRSLSCPSLLPHHHVSSSPPDSDSEPETKTAPPTSDFITKEVDECSGDIQIIRDFHEHPLALSAAAYIENNCDAFNFCCLCKIYFTAGAPIYSCVQCRMFLHQSCGELPMWIDSAWHPRHRLKLKVADTLEPCVGGSPNGILTSTYGCSDCDYKIYIGDALQSIPFSQFKHSYLNPPASSSSSLPLYLKQGIAPLKEEDFSRMVSSRKLDNQIDNAKKNVAGVPSDYGLFFLCNYYMKWAVGAFCDKFHFTLHQAYARSPKLIKSVLHPEHLLDFRPPPIESISITQFCHECDERIMRTSRYTCQLCHIDFHFECVFNTTSSLAEEEKCRRPQKSLSRSLSFPMEAKRGLEIIFSQPPPNARGISLTYSSFLNFQLGSSSDVDQMDHFLHRHPLVPLVIRDAYKLRIHCKLCGYVFSGDVPIYGCYECQFFLDESCARLPQLMLNTLHPEYILQLIEYDKESLSEGPCKFCYETDFFPWNYCYGCTDCGDIFHCKCALIHNFEDHEHTFHFIKASLFTCDACGITENKGVSSVCTNCPLQVHKRCSYSFPRSVKQKRHHHKLDLTYSFGIDFDYAKETCNLCFNQMNNVYCMYQCTQCTYMAHVTCATSKEIVEKKWSVGDIVEDESLVNNNIEEECVTSSSTKDVVIGNRVEHFGHPHPLILTDEGPAKIEAYCCNACVSPISAPPFYVCATDDDQCNFYLHKHCFELPLEIQHTLHDHTLTLTSKEEFFICYGCGFNCNGFKYSCYDCGFYIDVRCSLLSDTLNHDSHGCILILIDNKYVRHDEDDTTAVTTACSVCDRVSDSSCKFLCRGCNFHLDLGCASLPKSVTHECPKHDWKAHPLQLTYGGIPDASGIYFCDMCEESRVLSHWFYDCDDCVWSNHPKCVLGEFQFKYGKRYQIKGHNHALELVKKPLSRHNVYSCDDCKEPLMDDSPLFCGECNLYFHRHVSEDSESVQAACGIM